MKSRLRRSSRIKFFAILPLLSLYQLIDDIVNSHKTLIVSSLIAALLAGCDQLGIETPDKVAARIEADGKAIGGACRHAGRALEDCYDMNRRASKAAIYAGWRDMDAYMRENNIAVVKPDAVDDDAKPKAVAQSKPNPDEAKPASGEKAGNDAIVVKPTADTKPATLKAPTKNS